MCVFNSLRRLVGGAPAKLACGCGCVYSRDAICHLEPWQMFLNLRTRAPEPQLSLSSSRVNSPGAYLSHREHFGSCCRFSGSSSLFATTTQHRRSRPASAALAPWPAWQSSSRFRSALTRPKAASAEANREYRRGLDCTPDKTMCRRWWLRAARAS